jgi:hypothetical protein
MDTGAFQDRLLPRERILWSGAPATGLLLTSRDAFLVPFSLLWCAFVVFWTLTAVKSGAPFAFYIFGVVFICIGAFMAIGRFAVDAWLRQRTSYALTNQRILILRAPPFSSFTSLDLQSLPQIQLVGAGKGRGSLRFGPPMSYFGNRGMSGWTPALDPIPQFLAIEEAPKVFDLITRASNDTRSKGPVAAS